MDWELVIENQVGERMEKLRVQEEREGGGPGDEGSAQPRLILKKAIRTDQQRVELLYSTLRA